MSAELQIDAGVHRRMLTAARASAPQEACGLLGGAAGRASAFYELANADSSGEHYTMRPEEQFAAIKDMRSKGMRMVAIWHSHPSSPARMSDEDLRLAYTPDVVYVIVSLADPLSPETSGYVVRDGVPDPVPLRIVEREPRSILP